MGCVERVVGGGTWRQEANGCRSAGRANGDPGGRFSNLGLPPARSGPQASAVCPSHPCPFALSAARRGARGPEGVPPAIRAGHEAGPGSLVANGLQWGKSPGGFHPSVGPSSAWVEGPRSGVTRVARLPGGRRARWRNRPIAPSPHRPQFDRTQSFRELLNGGERATSTLPPSGLFWSA